MIHQKNVDYHFQKDSTKHILAAIVSLHVTLHIGLIIGIAMPDLITHQTLLIVELVILGIWALRDTVDIFLKKKTLKANRILTMVVFSVLLHGLLIGALVAMDLETPHYGPPHITLNQVLDHELSFIDNAGLCPQHSEDAESHSYNNHIHCDNETKHPCEDLYSQPHEDSYGADHVKSKPSEFYLHSISLGLEFIILLLWAGRDFPKIHHQIYVRKKGVMQPFSLILFGHVTIHSLLALGLVINFLPHDLMIVTEISALLLWGIRDLGELDQRLSIENI